MSVKYEEPIDELTVQVWLLYYHPNFKNIALFVSGMELWTDGDGWTIWLLDAPADLSGPLYASIPMKSCMTFMQSNRCIERKPVLMKCGGVFILVHDSFNLI